MNEIAVYRSLEVVIGIISAWLVCAFLHPQPANTLFIVNLENMQALLQTQLEQAQQALLTQKFNVADYRASYKQLTALYHKTDLIYARSVLRIE